MQANIHGGERRIPAREEFSFPCESGGLLRMLEPVLEERHRNIFSSIENFRVSRSMGKANALIFRKEGRIANVFLFKMEGRRAIVMNETIPVGSDDMLRAVRHIFDSYASIAVILWRAIQTDVRRFPYPFQRFNYSEDIVVALPPSEREYLASLGHSTRKYLVRYRNRLTRENPGFRYRVLADGEINEDHIRRIIEFNRERMSGKNRICGYDEQEIRRLIALARTHGFLVIATMDGRICAGSICYRVGDNFFMEITAHDSAFDRYRLGRLCCYQAICEAIACRGREFHLLWGRDEYKYLFLGKQRDLDNVYVYRSRLEMLRNAALVLQAALRGWLRRLKLRLQDGAAQGSVRARLLKKAGALWRDGRQLRSARR